MSAITAKAAAQNVYMNNNGDLKQMYVYSNILEGPACTKKRAVLLRIV